ncbi:hypothetical protein BH09BAC1_BH09BAC1_22630 [soil metagenome]
MELFLEAISLYNIAWTILLVLCIAYWLMVIVGLADIDFLDIDMDVDHDLDLDGDADIHKEISVDPDSWLHGFMKFFNMGEVPLMVILTVFALSGWAINVLLNYYLNPGWGWLAAVFMIPAVVGGLILSKIITTPLINFYKKLGYKGEEPIDYLGRTGVVTVSVEENKLGQAEIMVNGDPMIVNVKSKKGKLPKGSKVSIAYEGEGNRFYWAETYETID